MTDITDVDSIYLNVVFSGADPVGTADTVPAEYETTRTQAIISKADDFYLSVIRMTLPLNSEPIYIVPIIPAAQQTGAFNPLLTPWTIGIFYGGVYRYSVMWQPEIYVSSLAFDPNPGDYSTDNAFWWMYSYDTLLSMINTAMAQAFLAYSTANPTAPGASLTAPYLVYDPATELLAWVAPSAWSTPSDQSVPTPTPLTPRITMNLSLQSILDGFRTLTAITNPIFDPTTANVLIVLTQTPTNSFPTNQYSPPTVPAFFKVEQSVSTIATWASLRRIIITSGSLPFASEIIPGPALAAPTRQNTPLGPGGVPLYRAAAPSTFAGGAPEYPILCDFVPDFTNTRDVRGVVHYTPDAQYRLVNLISSSPLYKLDFQIAWVDTTGNYHPVRLGRNQQASIKIAFVRKNLYLNVTRGAESESHARENQLKMQRDNERALAFRPQIMALPRMSEEQLERQRRSMDRSR